MSVYVDSCPSLDECDEIVAHYWSLETQTDDCTGPFERWIPDDYYTMTNPQLFDNCFYAPRIVGNTYLFFSTFDFRWICSTTIDDVTNGGKCRDYNTSTSIINYQLDPQWQKFKEIRSINDYSWSFTDEELILIECSSASPTKSPTPSPIVNYTLDETELSTLRSTIRTAFDNSGSDRPLLAASIRLLFNDCIGPKENNNDGSTIIYDDTPNYEYNTICDGCINFRDMDGFHAGLDELAIEPLDYIFLDEDDPYSGKMSLSDFWAAAATIAIEYAVQLSGFVYDDGSTFELPLYFGRVDCSDSPDIAINSTTEKNLDAIFSYGFDGIIAFFADHLNFTTQEAITILSVNGLGIRLLGNYEEYSTYTFGDLSSNTYSLDNSYYEKLVDSEWISIDGTTDSYWGDRSSPPNIMLNSDITLAWIIDNKYNETTNEYDCTVNPRSTGSSSKPACERRTYSEDEIDTYIFSNQVLLDDLKKVWMKLVTTGYDTSDLRIDDLITTEPPETTEADSAFRNGILYHTIISIFIVVTTIYCAIIDEY